MASNPFGRRAQIAGSDGLRTWLRRRRHDRRLQVAAQGASFTKPAALGADNAGLDTATFAVTAAAVVTLETLDGPVDDGSKMNVPPAPTVRLVPTGKAPEWAMTSVPLLTVVPPL